MLFRSGIRKKRKELFAAAHLFFLCEQLFRAAFRRRHFSPAGGYRRATTPPAADRRINNLASGRQNETGGTKEFAFPKFFRIFALANVMYLSTFSSMLPKADLKKCAQSRWGLATRERHLAVA